MVTVVQNPVQEFKRLIDQYELRLGGPIGRVVCSGGVSSSPYFVPYVRDVLAREVVTIGNPFTKVAYPAFMEDTLRDIAPTFGPALGAALRQFQYGD